MRQKDVVKYSILTQNSENSDYSYGKNEYRDFWTGELVALQYWSSADTDFAYCPVGGRFGTCPCLYSSGDLHGELWEKIRSFDIVQTVYID
jgi:hypothetical protein